MFSVDLSEGIQPDTVYLYIIYHINSSRLDNRYSWTPMIKCRWIDSLLLRREEVAVEVEEEPVEDHVVVVVVEVPPEEEEASVEVEVPPEEEASEEVEVPPEVEASEEAEVDSAEVVEVASIGDVAYYL